MADVLFGVRDGRLRTGGAVVVARPLLGPRRSRPLRAAARSRPARSNRDAVATDRRVGDTERRTGATGVSGVDERAAKAPSAAVVNAGERTPLSEERLISGRPGACGARPGGRAPAGPPELRPTRLVDGVADPEAPCAAFPLTRPRCGCRRRAMAVGPEFGPRLERPRMLEAIGRARDGVGSSLFRRRCLAARMANKSLSNLGSSVLTERLIAAGYNHDGIFTERSPR